MHTNAILTPSPQTSSGYQLASRPHDVYSQQCSVVHRITADPPGGAMRSVLLIVVVCVESPHQETLPSALP